MKNKISLSITIGLLAIGLIMVSCQEQQPKVVPPPVAQHINVGNYDTSWIKNEDFPFWKSYIIRKSRFEFDYPSEKFDSTVYCRDVDFITLAPVERLKVDIDTMFCPFVRINYKKGHIKSIYVLHRKGYLDKMYYTYIDGSYYSYLEMNCRPDPVCYFLSVNTPKYTTDFTLNYPISDIDGTYGSPIFSSISVMYKEDSLYKSQSYRFPDNYKKLQPKNIKLQAYSIEELEKVLTQDGVINELGKGGGSWYRNYRGESVYTFANISEYKMDTTIKKYGRCIYGESITGCEYTSIPIVNRKIKNGSGWENIDISSFFGKK